MPGMPSPPIRDPNSAGLLTYAALACVTTWLLALPAARAWANHLSPPPYAVACAGLSAFGPLMAALIVGARCRALGQIFGAWRVNPLWIAAALGGPLLVHTLARLAFMALGGHPARWLDPPATAEAAAALVVFPLGEEFGWRGFAHPRMTARFGPVRGPLLLGGLWGLWHLAFAVTPAAAGFDGVAFATVMLELPLYSLIIAWLFERSGRSMAVALAFHAGAHLDHLEPVQRAQPGLFAVHLVVAAVLAGGAAWSLARRATGLRRHENPATFTAP